MDNWVVGNLQNALNTWNDKLSEIWTLLTQSPETFRGGGIWNVIVNINGTVQAIGLALLVIFFLVGVVKTCRQFCRSKKARSSFEVIYTICIIKSSNNIWIRVNVGDF